MKKKLLKKKNTLPLVLPFLAMLALPLQTNLSLKTVAAEESGISVNTYQISASNDLYAGMSGKETLIAALDYINENANCVTSYYCDATTGDIHYEQLGCINGFYFDQTKYDTDSDNSGKPYILYTLLTDEDFSSDSPYWFDFWENFSVKNRCYLEDAGKTGTVKSGSDGSDAYKEISSDLSVLLSKVNNYEDSAFTRQDDGDTILVSTKSYSGGNITYSITNGLITSSQSDSQTADNASQYTYFCLPEEIYPKILDIYQNGDGAETQAIAAELGF